MENLKKTQIEVLEMKIMSKMKNTLYRVNSKLDKAEEISELEEGNRNYFK